MGLLLTTGEYVKIKDYSITANELQYYHFKNYAARTAMTEVEMAKIKPVTLKIPIIMSGTADSSKSIQDNLKTIAYECMYSAVVNHSTIVTTTTYPFKGAANI